MDTKTTSAKNTEWKRGAGRGKVGAQASIPHCSPGNLLVDVLKVLQGGPDRPNQIRILTKNQDLRTIHAGCRSRRWESFPCVPVNGRSASCARKAARNQLFLIPMVPVVRRTRI